MYHLSIRRGNYHPRPNRSSTVAVFIGGITILMSATPDAASASYIGANATRRSRESIQSAGDSGERSRVPNQQARAENEMYRCMIGNRLRVHHHEFQKREALIAVNVINRMTALWLAGIRENCGLTESDKTGRSALWRVMQQRLVEVACLYSPARSRWFFRIEGLFFPLRRAGFSSSLS